MRGSVLAVLAAVLILAACAERETVVLLKDDAGHVGALTVTSGASAVTLDRELATASLRGDALEAGSIDETALKAQFGAALAALPERSSSFVLYFKSDTTDLTAESEPELPRIFAEIDRRQGVEVVVIGHTDRSGELGYNDRLSLERAEAIRAWLIGKGVKPEIITVAGRGEREPLVATADGVREARNRRVEILVR
jgi:OmpA-OmpF porin, OOP family